MNRRFAKSLLPWIGLTAAVLLLFLVRLVVLEPDRVDDEDDSRRRDAERARPMGSPGGAGGADAREDLAAAEVLLRVRVSDSSGAPVPGVLVSARFSGSTRRETWEAGAFTDSDGLAGLPGAPGDARVVCTVRRHAHALGVRIRRRTPRSGTLECSVVLDDRPGCVTGILTGAGASPPFVIGQVEVPANGLTVPTDDQGRFVITGLADDAQVTLRAHARGFFPTFIEVRSGDVISIALRRGSTITGRIVDAGGGSVMGARVRCSSSAHEAGGYRSFTQNGVSGPDGRFELTGVRPDVPARLAVEAGMAGKAVLSVPTDRIASGAHDVGDVTVRGGCSVDGVVTDDKGKPVVDASIHLLEQRRGGSCVSEWTRSDLEGRFSFRDLPPARYRVKASEGAVEAAEVLELRESDPEGRLRLELRFTGSIRVIVVDDRARPVCGLRVSLEVSARGRSLYAWTDERGVARLAVDGESDRHLAFSGSDDAGRPVIPTVLRTPVRSEETRVTVRFGARAHGRVVDEAGRPLPGAHVVAMARGVLLARTVADETGAFSVVIDPTDRTTVALDGRRRVTTPSGGYHDEDAHWTGRVSDAWAGTPMELIARPRGRDGYELTVTLLDAVGSPVPGVTLFAESMSVSSTASSTTDATGKAVLRVRGSGLRRLRVGSSDSEEHFVVHVTASAEIVWRLPEDRAIVGRIPALMDRDTGHAVLTLDGRPVARAEVESTGSFVLISSETIREWAELIVTWTREGGKPVEHRRRVILPSDARVELREK